MHRIDSSNTSLNLFRGADCSIRTHVGVRTVKAVVPTKTHLGKAHQHRCVDQSKSSARLDKSIPVCAHQQDF